MKELEEPLANWKQKKTMKEVKDGHMLNIYQKKVEGHTSDFVRVEAMMENVTQDQLADIYRNPSQDQMSHFKMHKVIEKTDETYISHDQVPMPMMSDRDGVFHQIVRKMSDGNIFIQLKTLDREDCPPAKGVVRMFYF